MGSTYAVNADAVALYRTLTICSGIISVYLVYMIGKHAQGTRTGLVAAALAAISPALIADCRHATPDSYVVLFELLTILASLAIAQSGLRAFYVAAGAAAGATIAAKFNGVAICLCLLAAHFVRFGHAPKEMSRLVLSGVICAIVFFACSPLFSWTFSRSGLTHPMFSFITPGSTRAWKEGRRCGTCKSYGPPLVSQARLRRAR